MRAASQSRSPDPPPARRLPSPAASCEPRGACSILSLHPRGTHLRQRRDRPLEAPYEGSSPFHLSSARRDWETERGKLRLPVACARVGIAVASCVRPTPGVPWGRSYEWGERFHRLVPTFPSDGLLKAGTVHSCTVINRRSRARARCATLRYLSALHPCIRQNSPEPICREIWLARTSR